MDLTLLGVEFEPTGRMVLRPQLRDREDFEVTSHTGVGVNKLRAIQEHEFHRCQLESPNPVNLRTIHPMNSESHPVNSEFETTISGGNRVEFDVRPYPINRLILV